jgi:hypothetical protein
MSLFGGRLPKYATSASGDDSELVMWRAIKGTIDAMHQIIDEIHLDDFNAGTAMIYEENLRLIKVDIERSAIQPVYKDPKYTGYEQVVERIKDCRVELGIVIRYHGKSPDDHRQALQAINRLQKHLKDAQEYINPIYNHLNPGTADGTSGTPTQPTNPRSGGRT